MEFYNGFLGTATLQDSPFFEGTLRRQLPEPSLYTRNVERALNSISAIAGAQGVSVDKVVTTMLENSSDILSSYVQKKGIVPLKNSTVALSAQAALLRLADIAYVSKAADCNDLEASYLIEQSESDALEMNYPGSEYILPPEVAACIKLIIGKLASSYSAKGINTLSEIVEQMKLKTGYEGLEFDPSVIVVDAIRDEPAASEGYLADLAYNQQQSYPDNFTGKFNRALGILPGELSTTGTFPFIDNIVDKITGGIEKIKNSAQDNVNDAASKAFKDALMKNLPIILGIVLLIGLTVYLAVYAAKNK